MTEQSSLLRIVGLKGLCGPDELAAIAGLDGASVETILSTALAAGEIEPARGRIRLTATGQALVGQWLAQERSATDEGAAHELYRQFHEFNDRFKALVTDWQLRAPDRPNDHQDEAYDQAIVARLGQLHEQFLPVTLRWGQLVPRLGPYRARFVRAWDNVAAGERKWLAGPLIDSYHTVWFELHEDLLAVTGIDRVAEESGRS